MYFFVILKTLQSLFTVTIRFNDTHFSDVWTTKFHFDRKYFRSQHKLSKYANWLVRPIVLIYLVSLIENCFVFWLVFVLEFYTLSFLCSFTQLSIRSWNSHITPTIFYHILMWCDFCVRKTLNFPLYLILSTLCLVKF